MKFLNHIEIIVSENTNKKKVLTFCLFFILTLKVFALTEQAFIQKVLSQDTHFEKDQIYVAIKKLELDASRQSYAGWNADLTASLNNSYYDIDKNTDSSGIYEKHRLKNNQSISLALEKRFLSNPSGLKFAIMRSTPDADIERYKKDKPYITSKYGGSHSISTFDNRYKISYKYPLLKHDSNATSLKSYHRDVLDLAREKLDFYDAQEDFLVDRLTQYFLWSLYEKNAEIYKTYLQTLQSIDVKPEDKTKLRTAILLAKKDILKNDSRLKAQKEALIVALNDPSLSLEKPIINYTKYPDIVTQLAKYLRKNSRKLLRYEIDQKLKAIDLKYYQNQALARLDFEVSAEKKSNKGNTLSKKYDNTSVDYATSLTLGIPLGGDVNNKKDIAIAQLNLRKLAIDFNNKLKDIKADVQALGVELSLSKQVLSDYKHVIISVAIDANLTFDNYFRQSVQLKNLIDVYKEKRDVELEYAHSIIEYQQNILEYNDRLDRVLPVTITLSLNRH